MDASAFDSANRPTIPVNLSISIGNAMVEWSIATRIKSLNPNDYSLLNADFVMSRGKTQKFFSLFVVLIMWAMSLGVFAMSFAHLWYSREVMPPTIVNID